MENVKKILSIIVLIFAASFVSAVEYSTSSMIFNATFNYSDAFTSHGWSFYTGGDAYTYPLNVSGYNGFGVNFTSVGSYTRALEKRNLIENISNGTAIMAFSFINIQDGSTATKQYVQFRNASGISPSFTLNLGYAGSRILNVLVAPSAQADCNMSQLISNDTWHDIIFSMDFDSKKYSVYMDGSCEGCCDISFSTLENFKIGFVTIAQQINTALTVKNLKDFFLARGSLSGGISCSYPVLFCDNFNYNVPLAEHGWQVYMGGQGIDNTFSPIQNKLNLQQDSFYSPLMDSGSGFPSNFHTAYGITVTETDSAPQFSSQFDLTLYNTSTADLAYCFKYSGFSSLQSGVYGIYICPNASIYYRNDNFNAESTALLCENCYPANNATAAIKFITYFQPRARYDFNSSVQFDKIDVYVNNALKGTINSFLDNQSYNLRYYYIVKENDAKFDVDNYYVMVGSDTNFDTSQYFFTQFFTEKNETATMGSGTGDLATAVSNIWADFGLKSIASRVIFGLALMFLLAIFTIGAFLKAGAQINIGAIVILEILFMIFLTYIKLIPVWIPIVLAILGAAIMLWYAKNAVSSQGG